MVGLGSLFGHVRALGAKLSSALGRRSATPARVTTLLVVATLAASYGTSCADGGGKDASDGAGGDTGASGHTSSGGDDDDGGTGSGAAGGSEDSGGDSSGGRSGGDSSGGSSSGGSSSGGSSGAGTAGGSGTGGVLFGATPCLSDEACASEGLVCLEGSRVCVECTNDAECRTGTWCDHEVCVPFEPCSGEEQCGGETPICYENASSGGRCVECFGNTGCPDGEQCYAEFCASVCTKHAECAAFGQVCHLAGGYCAECYLDVGCEADEFCSLRVCRPRRCTPAATRCLGGRVVTCETYGSGYFTTTSCGAYGCTMRDGEAVCDFPVSQPPAGALNTDGNFDAGGADWHQDDAAVQLTSGMVCTNGEGAVELGWPADVANAALLTYQKTYTLKFRTSLVLAETWGFGRLDVKVGGPASPFVEYFSEPDIVIVEGVQNYEYSFTMAEPTGSAGIVLRLNAVAAELCVDEIWLVSGSG
jgi:hypothetical protein